MAAILEIQNVTKTFRGGVRAVDDVTLAVEEGEFLTILGPSGCGKTTTLRMVGGFEFPDAGRVVLDGRDVTDLPPYRRPVNMMFQDFALFPHLTVAQNIGYGLTIAGMKRREAAREVEEALHTIELLDKADRRPAELSIGQKQRVALARALIRRPKILLLDEPLSALDAKLRESMQVELKRLHDQIGLTFIMVTHDQTEALVMSDRIVVMDAGRIVQAGSPTDLYDRPETPYVANFLGTSNMVAGVVTGMSDGTLQVSCGTADIRVALQGAAPAVGARVTLSIRPEKVALGDGRALPAGFNSLSGQLRDVFFHGDSVRLAIDIGAERLLIVHRQLETGLHQMPLPPVGGTVSLSLRPGERDPLHRPRRRVGGSPCMNYVRRRRLEFAALVSAPLIWWVVVLLVPYVIMMMISFYRTQFPFHVPDFQVANYLKIFAESQYVTILLRSLKISIFVSIVTFALAYPLTYFLVFKLRSPRLRTIIYVATIVPLWVSYLLRVYTWKIVLGTEGILNTFLIWIGVVDEPIGVLLYNQYAMVITMAYIFTPFMVMPLFATLEKIPRSLIEGSKDLGVGSLGTFLRITLPLSVPGILVGFTFTFCFSFGDFISPRLVGGPYSNMISNVISTQFGQAMDWPFGSALSMIMLIIVLAVITASDRFERAGRLDLG